MIKIPLEEINLVEPALEYAIPVMEMRQEFFNCHCKFNGTCDLNLYDSYIDWLSNSIAQNYCSVFNHINCTKHVYLVFHKTQLIGMLEIIFYYNYNTHQQCAHIIECIRPSSRRLGYGKSLLKKATYECWSLGINKANISFENNSKACNGTMTKIIDF